MRRDQRQGHEPGKLGTLRRELISFLENSLHYKPEKLISSFPQCDMYEERALLLGRLERHEPALAIYAYILRAPVLAEDYCEKNYSHCRDVYLQLMKMYLITPDLEKLGIESPRRDKLESNMKSALALLSKYHEVIDTSQVLNLLPPDTPLRDLQVFLTSVPTIIMHYTPVIGIPSERTVSKLLLTMITERIIGYVIVFTFRSDSFSLYLHVLCEY